MGPDRADHRASGAIEFVGSRPAAMASRDVMSYDGPSRLQEVCVALRSGPVAAACVERYGTAEIMAIEEVVSPSAIASVASSTASKCLRPDARCPTL